MEANEINTIDDMQRYVEGCINDFEAGISTKQETIDYLKEYTFRIVDLVLEMKESNYSCIIEKDCKDNSRFPKCGSCVYLDFKL